MLQVTYLVNPKHFITTYADIVEFSVVRWLHRADAGVAILTSPR